MNKDRIEGGAEAAKGSVKEAIGKIIGNEATEAEGAAEKASGEAQEQIGKGNKVPRDKPKT